MTQDEFQVLVLQELKEIKTDIQRVEIKCSLLNERLFEQEATLEVLKLAK